MNEIDIRKLFVTIYYNEFTPVDLCATVMRCVEERGKVKMIDRSTPTITEERYSM